MRLLLLKQSGGLGMMRSKITHKRTRENMMNDCKTDLEDTLIFHTNSRL